MAVLKDLLTLCCRAPSVDEPCHEATVRAANPSVLDDSDKDVYTPIPGGKTLTRAVSTATVDTTTTTLTQAGRFSSASFTSSESVFEISSKVSSQKSRILRPVTDFNSKQLPAAVPSGAHLPLCRGWSMPGSACSLKLPRCNSSGTLYKSIACGNGQCSLLSAAFARVEARRVHSSANSLVSLGSGSSTSSCTSKEDEAVARQFAEAFLQAVLSGNVKWASEAAVCDLFSEEASMITHDKQSFNGKTAIIRRLNAGMEQFMKLVGQYVGETGTDLQDHAKRLDTSLHISCQDRAGRPNRKKAKVAGSPNKPRKPIYMATYTFTYGLRKLKLQDHFKVKAEKIVQLRRWRL